MFLSLWHYLKGYVIVEVHGGNVEKFLNLTTYHGLTLWNISHSGTGVRFCISVSEFKAIRSDVKKARCKIKVIKKKGWPFIAYRYKKRHLFVVGIGAFVMLLWLLSSFVWLIDVEGNDRVSSLDIIHTLEENGYETGRLKAKMNLRTAETVLLNAYPDLIWVGINYEGTRMIVRTSESVLPPEMSPVDSVPKALLAKRDALITYIAVEKGKPMVKAGDIVKKGEILVAGEMPLGEEEPTLYFTSAKATIKGKTIYTAAKELSLKQVKKQYNDKISKKYKVNFFDQSFTFFSQKPLDGPFDKQVVLHQLHITKLFPLPFGIETETQVGYIPSYYTLTEEDAQDLLLSSMWEDIKCHLSGDATVLTRKASFKRTGDTISGQLYIVAEESVSYEVDLDENMLNEGDRLNEQN